MKRAEATESGAIQFGAAPSTHSTRCQSARRNIRESQHMKIEIIKPRLGAAAAAFLARQHKLLIDGEWVDAAVGSVIEVEDPATEEIISKIPAGDESDIDRAVAAARRAFERGPWPRMTAADRSKLL